MNRKFIISHKWAAACILLVALAGCSKTSISPSSDPLDPPSGAPIEFSTPDAFTKAVVTDKSDIENDPAGIRVWDWYTSLVYPNGTHTFDKEGTPVKYSAGVWTYSPIRYWFNGTYDFAAVYPATIPVEVNGETDQKPISGTYAPAEGGTTPILTVKDFDVTNQDDLLVAFNNGPDGNGIDGSQGNANNPVNLNFKHALARVKFKLKLAEEDFFTDVKDDTTGEIHIEQIGFGYATIAGINGIYKTGTLAGTSNNELAWSLSAVGNLVVEYPSDSPIFLDSQNTNILGEDGLLVLPQSFENNNDAKLFCNLGLIFPNIADRVITSDIEVQLNTLKVKSWEANKVYVYEGVVTQDFKIEFNIVSITDWVDDTLGGLIIN